MRADTCNTSPTVTILLKMKQGSQIFVLCPSKQLIVVLFRELGGIPKLVGLLKRDDPVIQKNAAACLKNLSYGKENEVNKVRYSIRSITSFY